MLRRMWPSETWPEGEEAVKEGEDFFFRKKDKPLTAVRND